MTTRLKIQITPRVATNDDISLDVTSGGHLFRLGPIQQNVPLELTVLAEDTVRPRNRAKAVRRRSQRQEQSIAVDVGGRTQKGSGALAGHKGDVRKAGVLRVEAKYTGAASYTLHRTDLEKIAGECEQGENPAFVIRFIHNDSGRTLGEYAVVPYADWLEKVNDAAADD